MKPDGSSRFDDLPFAALIEHALTHHEGQLTARGAFSVHTARTGVVHRFVVNEPSVSDVIRADAQFGLVEDGVFKGLWDRVKDAIVETRRYRLHAHLGVDADIAVPLQITTCKAWHAMACHHLCHIPDAFNPREKPEWKLIWAPLEAFGDAQVLADGGGAIFLHVGKRRVLMGGDLTTGEMRRALLTVLGLLLPEKHMLPLHGAASQGDQEITLFLGPAGTQKTTWAMRCGQLIADRGLSWSEEGLHRLADGCRLHLDRQLPIRLDDALCFGTIAENLPLDEHRQAAPKAPEPESDPEWATEPVHLIVPLSRLGATAATSTRGPSQLVILATDPLGVLPPLAKLTKEQALVFYMLGYSNHYGPLEQTGAGIDLRFTPGFMDALLPRHLDDYLYILDDLLEAHQTRCFLVNAGWHGGPAGEGEPLPASEENAIITALYYCTDWEPWPTLDLKVPKGDSETAGPWQPASRWSNPAAYQQAADTLVERIQTELALRPDATRWLSALGLSRDTP